MHISTLYLDSRLVGFQEKKQLESGLGRFFIYFIQLLNPHFLYVKSNTLLRFKYKLLTLTGPNDVPASLISVWIRFANLFQICELNIFLFKSGHDVTCMQNRPYLRNSVVGLQILNYWFSFLSFRWKGAFSCFSTKKICSVERNRSTWYGFWDYVQNLGKGGSISFPRKLPIQIICINKMLYINWVNSFFYAFSTCGSSVPRLPSWIPPIRGSSTVECANFAPKLRFKLFNIWPLTNLPCSRDLF